MDVEFLPQASSIGPALVPVLSAAVAPITAAIVAWIAFQQWQTARQKLILDLFDRRFAAYSDFSNSVTKYLNDAVEIRRVKGALSPEELDRQHIYDAQRRMHFLFSEAVLEKSDEVVKEADRFILIMSQSGVGLRWPVSSEEMIRLQAELLELVTPFMKIGHIGKALDANIGRT